MKSFEEFLKEKSYFNMICGTSDKEYIMSGIPSIYIRDLGEWAWEEFENNIRKQPKHLWERMIEMKIENEDYEYQIAVACLGKEEILKRLEKLKKEVEGK